MNNFTPRAQQVLTLAQTEADKLDDNFVGTAHLLSGIVALGHGIANEALGRMNLTLDSIREAIAQRANETVENRPLGKRAPYTKQLNHTFALAGKESKSLNHSYVGTEHFLLGLLKERDGDAAHILLDILKLEYTRTREEIVKILEPYLPKSKPGTGDSRKTERTVSEYERSKARVLLPGSGLAIEQGLGSALISRTMESGHLYEDSIRPAFEANNISAARFDSIGCSGQTLSSSWESVRKAEIVVIDVGENEAEALFALGMCCGASRSPIVLIRKGSKLPDALRGLYCIEYSGESHDLIELKSELTSAVRAFLSASRDSL